MSGVPGLYAVPGRAEVPPNQVRAARQTHRSPPNDQTRKYRHFLGRPLPYDIELQLANGIYFFKKSRIFCKNQWYMVGRHSVTDTTKKVSCKEYSNRVFTVIHKIRNGSC